MMCPNYCELMEIKNLKKSITVKGDSYDIECETFKCSICGIEVATIDQCHRAQEKLLEKIKENYND